MPETIDLIHPMLGLAPYVLVEAEPSDGDDDGFDLKVRAGGGIDDNDTLVSTLLLVVEEITGVSTDDYVQAVEAKRAEGNQVAEMREAAGA